jgi:hypothetical protein
MENAIHVELRVFRDVKRSPQYSTQLCKVRNARARACVCVCVCVMTMGEALRAIHVPCSSTFCPHFLSAF